MLVDPSFQPIHPNNTSQARQGSKHFQTSRAVGTNTWEASIDMNAIHIDIFASPRLDNKLNPTSPIASVCYTIVNIVLYS